MWLLCACIALFGIAFVLSPGCTDNPQQSAEKVPAGQSDLQSGLWNLEYYISEEGPVYVPDNVDVTLTFGEDGRLYGNSGCNSYFADYTPENGGLEIGMIGSTLMACMDGDVMIIESVYLTLLDQVEGAYIEGERLVLTDGDGAVLLSFKKTVPSSPEGTLWTLASYDDGEGGLVSVPADTEITLKLEEGQAGGNAGCNSYFGGYELNEEGSLTFGMIGMTEMYCEGRMDLESRYLSLLGETAEYSMSDGVLTLYNSEGKEILVFKI